MTTLNEVQRTVLAQPIDPVRVKQRQGAKGNRLSYIETWDAKRAANEIFGHGNWGYEIMELCDLGVEQHKSKEGREGHRIAYRCRLRLEVIGCLPVEDVGYGEDVSYTSILQSHELAAKEAVSDALKRCLVAYGDQFGLGLYDKDAAEHKPRAGRAAKPPAKTRMRASQINLLKAAQDANVDDDLRHRIIRFLTRGGHDSVKTLQDDQADKITAQLAYFQTHREAAMRELEAWEANQ